MDTFVLVIALIVWFGLAWDHRHHPHVFRGDDE